MLELDISSVLNCSVISFFRVQRQITSHGLVLDERISPNWKYLFKALTVIILI